MPLPNLPRIAAKFAEYLASRLVSPAKAAASRTQEAGN
jgi:hypothetical protein